MIFLISNKVEQYSSVSNYYVCQSKTKTKLQLIAKTKHRIAYLKKTLCYTYVYYNAYIYICMFYNILLIVVRILQSSSIHACFFYVKKYRSLDQEVLE